MVGGVNGSSEMKKWLPLILIVFTLSGYGAPKDSLTIKIIQNRKFIQHRVEKKETVYSLSRRYGISPDSILAANTPFKGMKTGMLLLIPLPVLMPDTGLHARTAEAAHANADAIVTTIITKHKVIKGETVKGIAAKYALTTNDLIKWNNIKDNKIDVGQILIVNPVAAIVPYKPWNRNNTKPEEEETSLIQDTQTIKPDYIAEDGIALLVDGITSCKMKTDILTGFVKITNLENNKQYIVAAEKDTSTQDLLKDDVILLLDKDTAQKLGAANTAGIRVEINYLAQDQ